VLVTKNRRCRCRGRGAVKRGGDILEQWGEQITRGGALRDVINGIADALSRERMQPGITDQQREDAGPFLPLTQGGVVRMAEADRQRKNAAAAAAAQGLLPAPTPALRSGAVDPTAGWKQRVNEINQQNAADATAKAKIDAVTDALTEQSRTAGMCAACSRTVPRRCWSSSSRASSFAS
jgi:hypothetical protein